MFVADIGNIDTEPVFYAGNVKNVTPVLGDEAVEDSDTGVEFHKPASEIRAEEAQAAGDENGLICEGVWGDHADFRGLDEVRFDIPLLQ
jgi:hypothetical protein